MQLTPKEDERRAWLVKSMWRMRWSAKDAASIAGVTPNTINQWRCGSKAMPEARQKIIQREIMRAPIEE